MSSSVSELFPALYGVCFLLLLWQAFQVMGKGFRALSQPGDAHNGSNLSSPVETDRTGRLTVHPELLDADGELTREDLLTVRFSGDNDQPPHPGDGT